MYKDLRKGPMKMNHRKRWVEGDEEKRKKWKQ